MKDRRELRFKIATEPWEFEQIHRLNHRTFAEEIPQHAARPEGVLVDRFHGENTYVIALEGERLVGMVCVRGRRPFSLDGKLPDLDSYLPKGRSLCELRLLSVEKEYRNGRVFAGLIKVLLEHCLRQGWDTAVISGATDQVRLYRHVGFVPFGPMVGTEDARFQPMVLTRESMEQHSMESFRTFREGELVNLLPGPVGIHERVRRALAEAAVSHRSRRFMDDFHELQASLCRITGARHVQLLMGSGSLANEAIGAQLTLESRTGLVLSNGEFGRRLVDHATRWGLPFEVLEQEWGGTFDAGEIRRRLRADTRIGWLWAVHCETSTGVLNDIATLEAICRERDVKLCLDCVSSIGTVPVDLSGTWLASCVSGKGFGSFPGIAMVFHNHEIPPQPTAIPRYLDLGYYVACEGVAFTISSNLIYALKAAADRLDPSTRSRELRELTGWVKSELRNLGFRIVAPDAHSSPAVVTIELPLEISSERVGDRLEESGFLLSYRSSYLLRRNWIQICLMGEFTREGLERLVLKMEEILRLARIPPRPDVAAHPEAASPQAASD